MPPAKRRRTGSAPRRRTRVVRRRVFRRVRPALRTRRKKSRKVAAKNGKSKFTKGAGIKTTMGTGPKSCPLPRQSRGEKICTTAGLNKFLRTIVPHMVDADYGYQPLVVSTKHHGVEEQNIVLTIAGTGSLKCRPNVDMLNLYNPWNTAAGPGTGGQAEGTAFDLFRGRYKNYVVTGFDFSINVENYFTGVASGTINYKDTVYIGWFFSNDDQATMDASFNTYHEIKQFMALHGRKSNVYTGTPEAAHFHLRKLPPPKHGNLSGSTDVNRAWLEPGKLMIKGTFDPRKFADKAWDAGVDADQRMNRYMALNTQEPTDNVYLNVFVCAEGGFPVTPIGHIHTRVDFTQHATWWKPADLTQSRITETLEDEGEDL